MKRHARPTVSASASAARKNGSGVLELARAFHCLQHSTEFSVDAEESQFTRWSVAILPGSLTSPRLKRELKSWAMATKQPEAVQLEIVFSDGFPSSVPSVRVVRPRFKWRTGHVTIGGSFCTELLTNQGWREMTVDALLRTVVCMLHDGEARIQLEPDEHCSRPFADYSCEEATDAFQRAKAVHGWM